MTPQRVAPTLGIRLLSLLYEALLLAAVILLSAGAATAVTALTDTPPPRWLTQIVLITVGGLYFVWQWLKSGQTLPMKTWRIRVESISGVPLTPRQAVLRFIYALITYPLFGLTIAWTLCDKDRQFLHDRLAGTRLVNTT